MDKPKEYKIDYVTSTDGTKIGYRQLGSGEGLILVHGGLQASQNFMELAKELSNEFTVYIPDRRGRGLSGAYSNKHILKAESEDIQAIINKTKTQNIFGLSSGAIIALQTAIIGPALKKVVLYEPPIPVNGKKPFAFFDEYENALSKGNLGKAFIKIIKATDGSSLFGILPGFITIPLMNYAIKADAKKGKADYEVSLKDLIPTYHYDAKIVFESEGIIEKCKDIKADILLLGGQKSWSYLKIVLDTLSAAFPQAKRIELSGVGHIAADNSEKPKVVANELRNFFAAKK
jgi:pimeloyl-ACP methyl ester carboxylesterase